MAFEELDVVKVELDMYANGSLVQTTDEKKGKEQKLENQEYGPQSFIIGKKVLLEALDNDMLKAKEKEARSLKLSAEEAFGKRNKDYIKTFTKKSFDEQKIRAVPGATYDFNGMYGTVKSVVGGRVMVDFNNPLAGKDIEINYTIKEKVDDAKEIFSYVLFTLLKMPKDSITVESEGTNVTLYVPKQLLSAKDQLEEVLSSSVKNFSNYSIEYKEK